MAPTFITLLVSPGKVKFSADDVVDFCVEEIKKIQQANKTLNTDRVEALRFYRGDPEIVDVVAQRSKATTTDLQDLVEWAKPSLLGLQFGEDEPTITGEHEVGEPGGLPVADQAAGSDLSAAIAEVSNPESRALRVVDDRGLELSL